MPIDRKRQLVLGVFLTRHGHHPGSWRLPGSPGGGDPDFQYWLRLTQTAERGKLDSVFFADFVGMGADDVRGIGRRPAGGSFEPLSLVSALSIMTKNIGLIATVNTNFSHPYTLARQMASIDHLSGGRAGWNVVSSLSPGSIRTFGVQDPLDHSGRYDRAAEFIAVAKKYWDSWDDGVFNYPNKQSGQYLDPASVHPVNHHGRHFDSESILDIARPVQGYPVFVQAGNSETGRDFAAQHAEMIYAAAQFVDDARDYYDDVKSRLPKFGRAHDQLKVTPGLSFAIGATESEAREKFEALQAKVDLTGPIELIGEDVSHLPLDKPIPDDYPVPENGKGRWEQIVRLGKRENLTLRQLVLRYNVVRGHRIVIGTPTQVADQIEDWFTQGVVDGFNLIPPLNPGFLEDFVDLVVPQLQKRGIFRSEYEGRTLRENLGLDRPANQHSNHLTSAIPAL